MKTKIILSSLLLLSPFLHAQQKPVAVTDMLRIKRAADVKFSPDGQQAVYTVNSIIPDTARKKDYTYQKQIFITDLTGNAQLLDTGSISQPAFNPSGKVIAYVKTADGKGQIFLYYPATKYRRQLTTYKYGAGDPRWSPDGKRLLFTTDIALEDYVQDTKKVPSWNNGAPGFKQNENLRIDTTIHPDPDGDLTAIRAYLNDNAKDRKAKVITHSKFQGETSVSADLDFSHIFITDTTSGAIPKELTPGFYSYYNPCFAGNDRIYFTASINDHLHPDDVQESQIYTVKTDSTGFSTVLSKPDMQYSVAAVSPSGRFLVYQASNTKKLENEKIYIQNLDHDSGPAVIEFDRQAGRFKFSADEKYLYFTAVNNGGVSLYRMPLKTNKPEKLTTEDEGIIDFDINGNKLLFAKTWIQNPAEVFLSDLQAKNPIAITKLNPWVAERQLSIPQKFTFTNSIGLTVEYWVMKPLNFDPNKKYPVLVDMHGGPSAMWGPGESSMWHEFQYFCGKGFGIVYCNPRGSGGYGDKFLQANIRDWGNGPMSDVLTSLEKAEAQGWIDTSKLFLSGGSYAGYLTAWIVSHDHRFRAASCQRGVYDFKTFFGEGNAGKMIDRYFGGFPYIDSVSTILEAQSPINYVKNITTPLLIFHGENDLRTGVSQSEMLFKSLNTLGKPVEYVRHPGASHELVRSGDNRQRIDQMLRTYEFFQRFL